MTYREFVLSRLNPAATRQERIVNAALGLAGETAEATEELGGETAPSGLALAGARFADVIKKHVCHYKPINRAAALKELGDVRFYLELAAWCMDATMQEVEDCNRDKLKARVPQWLP